MSLLEELELPELNVGPTGKPTLETLEAFELAHKLSEQGHSYFSGRNEYHKFHTEIPEEFVVLQVISSLAKRVRYGIKIETAIFRVTDTTDNSVMSLALWRNNASQLQLADPFSQNLLEYFRPYAAS